MMRPRLLGEATVPPSPNPAPPARPEWHELCASCGSAHSGGAPRWPERGGGAAIRPDERVASFPPLTRRSSTPRQPRASRCSLCATAVSAASLLGTSCSRRASPSTRPASGASTSSSSTCCPCPRHGRRRPNRQPRCRRRSMLNAPHRFEPGGARMHGSCACSPHPKVELGLASTEARPVAIPVWCRRQLDPRSGTLRRSTPGWRVRACAKQWSWTSGDGRITRHCC